MNFRFAKKRLNKQRREQDLGGQMSLWLGFGIAVSLLASNTAAQVAITGLLPNGTSYIQPSDLPVALNAVALGMGNRMTSANNALITISGTITDSVGSRPAQIMVQAPGYLAYREGLTRAITFNGAQLSSKSGNLSASDEQIAESLLSYYPDSVFLQIAAGGAWRRVGSRFRTTSDTSTNYKGPFWTLWEFAPAKRTGLLPGQPLQQPLFLAVDEATGLPSEVRVVTKTGANTQKVIQTQFSNWTQQGTQWFPGKIVRLENGGQVLAFQSQTVTLGVAAALTAFIP